MANVVHFADLNDGTTIEFKARRPKVQLCLPTDGSADHNTGNKLCGYVEGRGWTPITRTIVMKANPSRHECDARCMNATGRTMNCECSCGGANHGKGRFMCEAA